MKGCRIAINPLANVFNVNDNSTEVEPGTKVLIRVEPQELMMLPLTFLLTRGDVDCHQRFQKKCLHVVQLSIVVGIESIPFKTGAFYFFFLFSNSKSSPASPSLELLVSHFDDFHSSKFVANGQSLNR